MGASGSWSFRATRSLSNFETTPTMAISGVPSGIVASPYRARSSIAKDSVGERGRQLRKGESRSSRRALQVELYRESQVGIELNSYE